MAPPTQPAASLSGHRRDHDPRLMAQQRTDPTSDRAPAPTPATVSTPGASKPPPPLSARLSTPPRALPDAPTTERVSPFSRSLVSRLSSAHPSNRESASQEPLHSDMSGPSRTAPAALSPASHTSENPLSARLDPYTDRPVALHSPSSMNQQHAPFTHESLARDRDSDLSPHSHGSTGHAVSAASRKAAEASSTPSETAPSETAPASAMPSRAHPFGSFSAAQNPRPSAGTAPPVAPGWALDELTESASVSHPDQLPSVALQSVPLPPDTRPAAAGPPQHRPTRASPTRPEQLVRDPPAHVTPRPSSSRAAETPAVPHDPGQTTTTEKEIRFKMEFGRFVRSPEPSIPGINAASSTIVAAAGLVATSSASTSHALPPSISTDQGHRLFDLSTSSTQRFPPTVLPSPPATAQTPHIDPPLPSAQAMRKSVSGQSSALSSPPQSPTPPPAPSPPISAARRAPPPARRLTQRSSDTFVVTPITAEPIAPRPTNRNKNAQRRESAYEPDHPPPPDPRSAPRPSTESATTATRPRAGRSRSPPPSSPVQVEVEDRKPVIPPTSALSSPLVPHRASAEAGSSARAPVRGPHTPPASLRSETPIHTHAAQVPPSQPATASTPYDQILVGFTGLPLTVYVSPDVSQSTSILVNILGGLLTSAEHAGIVVLATKPGLTASLPADVALVRLVEANPGRAVVNEQWVIECYNQRRTTTVLPWLVRCADAAAPSLTVVGASRGGLEWTRTDEPGVVAVQPRREEIDVYDSSDDDAGRVDREASAGALAVARHDVSAGPLTKGNRRQTRVESSSSESESEPAASARKRTRRDDGPSVDPRRDSDAAPRSRGPGGTGTAASDARGGSDIGVDANEVREEDRATFDKLVKHLEAWDLRGNKKEYIDSMPRKSTKSLQTFWLRYRSLLEQAVPKLLKRSRMGGRRQP